jgi:hypothetical protein
MEAMAAAIQEFRPGVEVVAVGGDKDDLEAETERLKPQMVICNPPAPDNPVDERLALIELSPDSEQPSSFRVGERRWHSANPTLGQILSLVDETKGLFRSIRGPNG